MKLSKYTKRAKLTKFLKNCNVGKHSKTFINEEFRIVFKKVYIKFYF